MNHKNEQFKALVDAYHSSLFRYAFWLCRNKAVAEDLVQETYLRAWRAIDTLKEVKAAKSWLMTILRREYARLHEGNKNKPPVDMDVDTFGEKSNENDTSVEALLLRKYLKEMPEEYKEPLLLQVLFGFKCHEIAEKLNISDSAVMTRLFRARKMLRDKLTDKAGKQPKVKND